MENNYNMEKIKMFYILIIPSFICLIVTIYYQLHKLSGLLFIVIGLVFLLLRNQLSKYIYFKTYDTSIRFHTGDLNERKKYPMTSYEEMKENTLSSILLKNNIAALILIMSGIFFILIIN